MPIGLHLAKKTYSPAYSLYSILKSSRNLSYTSQIVSNPKVLGSKMMLVNLLYVVVPLEHNELLVPGDRSRLPKEIRKD